MLQNHFSHFHVAEKYAGGNHEGEGERGEEGLARDVLVPGFLLQQ